MIKCMYCQEPAPLWDQIDHEDAENLKRHGFKPMCTACVVEEHFRELLHLVRRKEIMTDQEKEEYRKEMRRYFGRCHYKRCDLESMIARARVDVDRYERMLEQAKIILEEEERLLNEPVAG